MAGVENERLQLPHVNLPDMNHLSEGRRQCLIDNHNILLDGITISPWFVEELGVRSLLTSRQRRIVESIGDQRAKAGVILEQVYRGSNGSYDSFQQALRVTNQEDLAKLIEPEDYAPVPDKLTMKVYMVRESKQSQKVVIPLPEELKSVFRPGSGKLSKLLNSRFKMTIASAEFVESTFQVELKFDQDVPFVEFKNDYLNGMINSLCNEKIRDENLIKNSDFKWSVALLVRVRDITHIMDDIDRRTNPRESRRSVNEDMSKDNDKTEDTESEDNIDETRARRGGVRLDTQKVRLECGCHGDGSCVKKTLQPASDGQSRKEIIAFNVLINKIKSHVVKGKNKNYNYSATEIFREIRSHQPMDYSKLTDSEGHSILHIMVLEQRMELLQVLLNTGIFYDLVDAKVSVSKSNLHGMTAMDIAMKYRWNKTQDEITKFLHFERSLTMMHKMVRIGDATAVKLLIERHPQMMNTPANDGSTALYWGVLSGDHEVVEHLLNAGARVNAKTLEGETMLGCAVRYSHKELVKMLVERYKVDPEQSSAEDKTPVTIAIENKDFQVLRQLVEVGAQIQPYNLPQIVNAGCRDSWVFVLKRFPGLDINYKDDKGKSCFIYACENANKDFFQDLEVKHKADLKVKDKRHRNILFAAMESCDYDFFKYVTGRLQHLGILHELMKERDNYVGSERCFLVSGRHDGRLGFHYLEVFRVYMDVFRGIIRRGGEWDVAKYGEVFKSGWGVPSPELKKEVDMRYDPSKTLFPKKEDMTPLHFALVREQPKMALELMRLGADVDVEDCFGLRPVHLACMRGYLNVLNELEERKANFNVYEKFGMTPAQVAEANGHEKCENFIKGHDDINDIQEARGRLERLLETTGSIGASEVEMIREIETLLQRLDPNGTSGMSP